MTRLIDMQCEHKSQIARPLGTDERDKLLKQIPLWSLGADGKSISRTFRFKNYYHTMSFVNAVAWIANKEAHHPDLEVSYNQCTVHYTTHDMDGLGIHDLICAAKIDALLEVGQYGPVLLDDA
jgi:4a-hydroxytetrahydrobiopterin dehydratase